MESSSSITALAVPSRLRGVAQVMALSVLEECTDALAVYQCSLKKQLVPSYRPTRFGTDYWRVQPDASLNSHESEETRAAFEMANEEVVIAKLRQDTQWLVNLMHSAKEMLKDKGNFDILVEEIAQKVKTRNTEEELLSKAREIQEKLARMRQEETTKQRSRKEEEKRLKDELLRLRNEKEKLELKSRVESDYSQAWLNSSQEQQELRVQMTHDYLTNQFRRCQIREDNERLVTDNIVSFLKQSFEEYEQGALNWLERRQQETQVYEKEIRNLRKEIEKNRSALNELQQQYKERQEFIDICLEEKEAARRQRELEEHVRGCAIKIQAWWRGVMVRRKLGPYRPEEKKRKRPGKAKK